MGQHSTTSTIRRRFLETILAAAIVALLLAALGCGGSGGGSSPTEPGAPAPQPLMGSASFGVSGSGFDESISYRSGTNLVFCRREAGWADLWIRFAEQSAGDGEAGPYLDLDLCELGDGGVFAPKDPMEASCAGAKTFDIFWHGGDGSVFANRTSASACSLEVVRDGSNLSGTFQCLDMRGLSGGTVDIFDGRFECTEE